MALTKVSYSMLHGAPGNVLDYGTFTTPASTTAAINACLSANAGGTVYIPGGLYIIDGALNIPSNTTILGAGKTQTKIKASTIGMSMMVLPNTWYNISISDLELNGDSKAATGIDSSASLGHASTAHLILDNIGVYHCTAKNIHLKSASYTTIQNVYCGNTAANTVAHGLYLDACKVVDILGGLYYNCKVACIELRSGTSLVRVTDVDLYSEDATASALLIIDGAYNNLFQGCSFEPQIAGAVTQDVILRNDLGNCTDNTFRNCAFIGVPTAHTRAITVTAYKTIIDECKFIKPDAGSSIILTGQQYTSIINCCDLISYDTPVFYPVTVTNNDSNPYTLTEQTFPLTAVFVPSFRGGISNPTVTAGSYIGKYTQTRDRIYFDLKILATTVTVAGTGGLEIELTGLPVVVGATPIVIGVTVGQHNLGIAAGSLVLAVINSSENKVRLVLQNGGSTGAVGADLCVNGAYIVLSGNYPII